MWVGITIAALAGVALAGCSRPPARNSAAAPVPDSLLAAVEDVQVVHAIAPGETLQVRLRGIVGPDGSWAADGVAVARDGRRIALSPRVKRVAGEAFIQMVIPLDTTVPLALGESGEWTLTVRRRGAPAHEERIRVQPGAKPAAAPAVRIEALPAVDASVVPVRVVATVADGWVARLEVRGFGADPAAWRDPGTALADGTGLAADFGVPHPPGDPARQVEARAVDGQGRVSAVATLELPARSE